MTAAVAVAAVPVADTATSTKREKKIWMKRRNVLSFYSLLKERAHEDPIKMCGVCFGKLIEDALCVTLDALHNVNCGI